MSSETQKRKKIQKIEFGMAKIYIETTNLKTKRICTSTQTTIVYTTLIQKKRPSVTQRTPGLEIILHKQRKRCKATKKLRQQS